MDCSAYREAISARIDGEDGGLEVEALDAHLETCPECHTWADTATAVTRLARMGVAEPVPDLATRIMAAISPDPVSAPVPAGCRPRRGNRRPAPAPAPASPGTIARWGLVMVAAAQACLALPALLGSDAGAPVHIAHQQGVWALALAVGLLTVAVRPTRAAALLPFVAALAGGLALTMAVDISAGRTQAAADAPNCLAFLGLGMLWLLSRHGAGTTAGHATRAGTPGMARAA